MNMGTEGGIRPNALAMQVWDIGTNGIRYTLHLHKHNYKKLESRVSVYL